MDFFTKLIFYFKKPELIIIADKNSGLIADNIFQVLKTHFKAQKIEKITSQNILKNKILILGFNSEQDLAFFIQKSKKPILIVNGLQEPSHIAQIKKTAKNFSMRGYLLLNFDNQEIREIDNQNVSSVISFGFLKNADLNISDFSKENDSSNFKINYKGNIVPIWLENISKKSEIYAILAAIACGLQLNMNLVEISQSIKNLKSVVS